MTDGSEESLPAGDQPSWRWPIDRSRYDCTPSLIGAEQEALIALGWNVRRRPNDEPSPLDWTAIERLVEPLDDARQSMIVQDDRYHRRSALDAVGIILHGCVVTQQPFWAWSSSVWVEQILCESQLAFRSVNDGLMDAIVRPYTMAIGYLLDCNVEFQQLGQFSRRSLANRVFGISLVDQAIDPIMTTLQDWGYSSGRKTPLHPGLVSGLLLLNRSPYLADLTTAVFEEFKRDCISGRTQNACFYGTHRAIAALGFADPPVRVSGNPPQQIQGMHVDWQAWVERWAATSTLTDPTRKAVRTTLFKVGRWLAQEHPQVSDPKQWTRELCAGYVASIDRQRVGDYAQRKKTVTGRIGKPLAPRTKVSYITAVRTFFRDCQEWEWIPCCFDPARALSTPRSISALIGLAPNIIADDVWAKLLWAGLNLDESDFPAITGVQYYPLQLMRALAVVWLFAGLRSDEIARLRLGCIRQQSDAVSMRHNADNNNGKDIVCLLDVPTHKTGTAFTKPVDPIVGHAIAAWEVIRPEQPQLLDRRTGERVAFLFCVRARRMAKQHLNKVLIPTLCRKAGVPQHDTRGRITSHRARATIASQLYNAKEPMTLSELQAWLGHRSPETTQHYAAITPTTLAKAYTDAGYFARNTRTIEVLIDRDAVEKGAAADGTPWQYFDLGHGYCTYSFFEQCPHRMACARCDFYQPKESTKSQLLEAKENLQRMRAAIPLTEDEQAAVEDGAGALDHLIKQLADVRTPSGETPQQLVKRYRPCNST